MADPSKYLLSAAPKIYKVPLHGVTFSIGTKAFTRDTNKPAQVSVAPILGQNNDFQTLSAIAYSTQGWVIMVTIDTQWTLNPGEDDNAAQQRIQQDYEYGIIQNVKSLEFRVEFSNGFSSVRTATNCLDQDPTGSAPWYSGESYCSGSDVLSNKAPILSDWPQSTTLAALLHNQHQHLRCSELASIAMSLDFWAWAAVRHIPSGDIKYLYHWHWTQANRLTTLPTISGPNPETAYNLDEGNGGGAYKPVLAGPLASTAIQKPTRKMGACPLVPGSANGTRFHAFPCTNPPPSCGSRQELCRLPAGA